MGAGATGAAVFGAGFDAVGFFFNSVPASPVVFAALLVGTRKRHGLQEADGAAHLGQALFPVWKDALEVGSVQFLHGEHGVLEVVDLDTFAAFRETRINSLKFTLNIKQNVDRVAEKLKKALLERDPDGYTEVTAVQATSADNVKETLSEGIS
eukprot:TRINITY_DN15935_c0_g1_i2.p1 TRINITY_DN15935_c0_g1~~TRINITY_DN15935_c0_g1_i2.p1  ORF type:complete len:153 (-),score=33.07 TRINITY_DN15935_c0_g1_i2:185-643(-)